MELLYVLIFGNYAYTTFVLGWFIKYLINDRRHMEARIKALEDERAV